ncbi:hypothetical protein AAFF_G00290520 [Aldrovandia affinis]|uniref:Uncharacterized protein n=1 Tax=Aldrovandia affinis TaxID=143900 RepID=A0AAD7R9T6_9TELE|nr:hypothetical protein AAFF_G00290520 [Aldrovandia affinis]
MFFSRKSTSWTVQRDSPPKPRCHAPGLWLPGRRRRVVPAGKRLEGKDRPKQSHTEEQFAQFIADSTSRFLERSRALAWLWIHHRCVPCEIGVRVSEHPAVSLPSGG